MGSTGTDRVKLHFEIRRQGKPVDPLQFLPRRWFADQPVPSRRGDRLQRCQG